MFLLYIGLCYGRNPRVMETTVGFKCVITDGDWSVMHTNNVQCVVESFIIDEVEWNVNLNAEDGKVNEMT